MDGCIFCLSGYTSHLAILSLLSFNFFCYSPSFRVALIKHIILPLPSVLLILVHQSFPFIWSYYIHLSYIIYTLFCPSNYHYLLLTM